MSEFNNPSLVLVNENVLSNWLDDDLAALYFTTMQDRHVPITPNLSRKLALMCRSDVPSQSPVWGRGFTVAGHAVGMSNRLGNSKIWCTTIEGFIQSIVEPILRKSSQMLGKVMILTKDSSWFGGNYGYQYLSYVKEIEKLVEQLLYEPKEMGQSFWTAAGITLLTHLRNRGAKKQFGALPYIDKLAVSMFYEIEPDFSNTDNQVIRRIKKTVTSQHRRFGIRPREGGVEGVIHSRRIEDLGEALPSSLIAPKEYRVLKLIEEGFFLTNRPPYRRPRRDILIVVICEETPLSESLQFVRSSWLDATIRLLVILKDLGLSRTELVLTDCKENGITSSAMCVESNAVKIRADPFLIRGEIRAKIFSQSTMCPTVFQTSSKKKYQFGTSDSINLKREGTVGIEVLNQAVKSTLLSAKSVHPKQDFEINDITGEGEDIENYSKILAISLRPNYVNGDELRVPNYADEERLLKSAFGSLNSEKLSTAFVYLPKHLDENTEFQLYGIQGNEIETICSSDSDDAKSCLERMSAEFSIWFMKQVLEVIDG